MPLESVEATVEEKRARRAPNQEWVRIAGAPTSTIPTGPAAAPKLSLGQGEFVRTKGIRDSKLQSVWHPGRIDRRKSASVNRHRAPTASKRPFHAQSSDRRIHFDSPDF